MSTRTKNAQSSSALLVEATPGLDRAEVERALAGCAVPAPAAPGVSANVIDGAVNRARVRSAIGEPPVGGGGLSDEVIDELLAGARTEEEVFGPGGVFAALTKRLVERAMEVELTDHLGYEPHYEPPGGTGNTRNGSTSKSLVTDHGKVAIDAPRDPSSAAWAASALADSSARRSRPRAISPTRTRPASSSTSPSRTLARTGPEPKHGPPRCWPS